MTKNAYIAITRTVFGAIAFVHLLRLFYGWEMQLGTMNIPMWVSIGIIFVTGILSLNGFTLNNK